MDDIYKEKTINKEWVDENYHGEKVFEIPEGYTEIGIMAFGSSIAAKENLEKIIIPEGVTKIRNSAFSQCKNLKEVVLPSSLEEINGYAFCSCSELNKINLPDNLKIIGKSSFGGCCSLENLYLPDSIIKIEQGIFEECTNLKSVRLPEGLESIPINAFKFCTALTDVNIPSSVKTLESWAFAFCKSLKSVDIKNTETIHKYAFSNCDELEIVVGNNKLKEIKYGGFEKCKSLKKADISGSLEKLGTHAFEDCKELSSFYFPEYLEEFTAPVFRGTALIKDKVYIEANKVIYEMNYENIKYGDEIIIPEGTHTIKPCVLEGIGASYIHFPKSLKSYSGEVSIPHIQIDGDISAFDKHLFREGIVLYLKAEGEIPYSILLEGSHLELNNDKALYKFLKEPSYENFAKINNSDYKISIATAYGMSQSDEFKSYHKYLRRAGNKAIIKMINDKNFDALNFYMNAQVITSNMCETGINYAVKNEYHEALVMLMQYKKVIKGYDKNLKRFDL